MHMVDGRRAHTILWLALLVIVIGVITVDAAPVSQAQGAKDKRASAAATSAAQRGATIPAVLTDAPLVPPRITRREPAKLVVELEVSEVNLPMADGARYEVAITQSGLLARPVNDVAKAAAGTWK